MKSTQNQLSYVNLNVISLRALYYSNKLGSYYDSMWVNFNSFSWGNFSIHVKPKGNMGQKWYQFLFEK